MRLTQYLIEEKEIMKNWKKIISKNKELSISLEILKKIKKKGYNCLIVGGSVRDLLLNNKISDIDIATNMPMDEISKIFKVYEIGKSKNFGIVVVKYKSMNFEIANFRTESDYIDNRRPSNVKIISSFEVDSKRRDFTINSLGLNIKGEIIDYTGGIKDLKGKKLATVGDPYKRFSEDFLRIMRLARFSSKLGFEIEKDTKKAAQKLSANILKLSSERIKDEIIKAASNSGEKFADYIIELDKLKILKHILPELVNLKWFKENLKFHPETRGQGGNVWAHTMEALRKSNTADPVKNLSILLHDIGKGVTFSQKEGLPRYLGHAKKSIDLVNGIADRLKMSNKERSAIIFAVGNHMKFHNILKMKPSKIAKLVNDEHWDVLVAVAKADEFSRGETFMHAGNFEKIIDKCIDIKNKFGMPVVNKQLKLVDGNRVMQLLNIKQGKQVGDIIRKVTTWIMDNDITDQKIIDKYIMDLK